MKILFSSLWMVLISTIAVSQELNYEWGYSTGGSVLDRSMAMDIDDNGNIIEMGNYRGTVDMDPGTGTLNFTSQGFYDTYIRKLDPNGNLIWAKSIGGNLDDVGRDVHVDQDNNVYITGNFAGTADFDPGAASVIYTSSGSLPFVDIFVLKLDSNGNYLWSHQIGGIDHDRGFAIASDQQNNVYVGGYFVDSVDFDPGVGDSSVIGQGLEDIYLLKMDASGNFIWVRTMGGPEGENLVSIILDDNNDLLLTGSFTNVVDFNPGTGVENHSSNGFADVFISKFNTSGDMIWTFTEGGVKDDGGQHVQVNDSNEIFLVGNFAENVDFDPTTGIDFRSSNGKVDVFLQKIGSNGNVLWTHTFGGDSTDFAQRMTIDAANNVFIIGSFEDTVDFDPGIAVNTASSNGLADIFISKFNSEGVHQWAEVFGDSLAQSAVRIDNDGNGNLYITGTYRGTVDFDPSPSVVNLSSNGQTDGYIIQYSYCVETFGSQTVNECESYVSPSGMNTWTFSGNYVDTLYNANVCGGDSIIYIQLTIDMVDNTISQLNEVTLLSNATGGATYQWIDCNTGPLAGEVFQTFTAASNGDYAVIVSNGSCVDTSSCIAITNVGLDENDNSLIVLIAPNPTSGELSVTYSASNGDFEVELYDVSGRILTKIGSNGTDQLNIDLKGSSGVYYLKIIDEEEVVAVRKVVKK